MSSCILNNLEFTVKRVLDYGDAVVATSPSGTTKGLLGAECELSVDGRGGRWRVVECAERRWATEAGDVGWDVVATLVRVEDLGRLTRFAAQRRERGFDDSELWNLDVTLAEHAIPRLEALGQRGQSLYVKGKLTPLKNVCGVIADGLRAYLEYNFEATVPAAAKKRVADGWRTLVRCFGGLWC